MPTKSVAMLAEHNIWIPKRVVTSKWAKPLEALTPHPKYARPLVRTSYEDIQSAISEAASQMYPGEVLLAHETTQEAAKQILQDGFEPMNNGYSSIRNNAVFGWIHDSDISSLRTESDAELNSVVLFAAHRDHVFVSSYETSARQLLLGNISGREYEEKHVLVYTDYEQLHWENNSSVEHLQYEPESLLPSK